MEDNGGSSKYLRVFLRRRELPLSAPILLDANRRTAENDCTGDASSVEFGSASRRGVGRYMEQVRSRDSVYISKLHVLPTVAVHLAVPPMYR